MSDSLYSLTATSLQGMPIDRGDYKGKVTLVVNVASACGYTPQYKGLQALRTELAGRGFEVLGFPRQRVWFPGTGFRRGDPDVL